MEIMTVTTLARGGEREATQNTIGGEDCEIKSFIKDTWIFSNRKSQQISTDAVKMNETNITKRGLLKQNGAVYLISNCQ